MKTLYIIRGLPGSGKSTLAGKWAVDKKIEHYEADMYFINKETGAYEFDPKKLGPAHEWCVRNVISAMYHGLDVIVSNTFTRYNELDDYLTAADRLKYNVLITECTAQYGSIHNVPEETMKKMAARWQPNDKLLGGVSTERIMLCTYGLGDYWSMYPADNLKNVANTATATNT